MADKQTVEITGLPEGHPPLMIFVNKPLRPIDCERIRDTLSRAIRDQRVVLLEPGMNVYQMIDGRWQPIHTDA